MNAPSDSPRLAPVWVQCLVLFHLFAIFIWTWPQPSPNLNREPVTMADRMQRARDQLLAANNRLRYESDFRYYLQVTGFWQYWDMFAPNPSNTDSWLTAEIEYADGQVVPVEYPRIKHMPIPQKYVNERYRKFTERLHPIDQSYKWAQFAYRMAYLNPRADGAVPTKVRLFKHFRIYPKAFQKEPVAQDEQFFELIVDPQVYRTWGSK